MASLSFHWVLGPTFSVLRHAVKGVKINTFPVKRVLSPHLVPVHNCKGLRKLVCLFSLVSASRRGPPRDSAAHCSRPWKAGSSSASQLRGQNPDSSGRSRAVTAQKLSLDRSHCEASVTDCVIGLPFALLEISAPLAWNQSTGSLGFLSLATPPCSAPGSASLLAASCAPSLFCWASPYTPGATLIKCHLPQNSAAVTRHGRTDAGLCPSSGTFCVESAWHLVFQVAE